ncbi:AAA ATPase midasin, partial [Perkinsus olseni]
ILHLETDPTESRSAWCIHAHRFTTDLESELDIRQRCLDLAAVGAGGKLRIYQNFGSCNNESLLVASLARNLGVALLENGLLFSQASLRYAAHLRA